MPNYIEISNKQIVFGGDFNLIFDCKLETNSGNPVLKKKFLAKLIEINESLNLCDIWRIHPPQHPSSPPPKKILYISLESGFWFHSKKTRLFFPFKHTSRFCQGNRCFCRMLKKIPGNVQEHSGECLKRFRGMLVKIPGNVQEDSGECLKILRNVRKDSGECSRRFREMFKKVPGNV